MGGIFGFPGRPGDSDFLAKGRIATFDEDKIVLKLEKDQHKNLSSRGVPR